MGLFVSRISPHFETSSRAKADKGNTPGAIRPDTPGPLFGPIGTYIVTIGEHTTLYAIAKRPPVTTVVN